MSATVNFHGNLVRDPETKQLGGQNACVFTVGVHTALKDADGNYKSDFYDCTLWGKRGEYLMQHAQKGTVVFVSGELALSEYKNKNGEDRHSLRCTVDRADIVAKGKFDTVPAQTTQAQQSVKSEADEIPF